MSNGEAIRELEAIKNTYKDDLKISNQCRMIALETAITALKSSCSTCRYGDVEPWDSPCCYCSHNHRDYYRPK